MNQAIQRLLTYLIASVWFINGLLCKVLGLVPRHEQIVARILGSEHSYVLTKTIGVLEVLMTIWILSNVRTRLCTTTQILIIGAMNILEFFLAPDLLLFGRVNSIIAAMFIGVVYYNEFALNRKLD